VLEDLKMVGINIMIKENIKL